VGCETFVPDSCDPSAGANPTVVYNGGLTQDGVYWSSAPPDGGTPWEGELLLFKGGAHYQLDHRLGRTPAGVQSFLSFDRFGTRDGGMLAPSAGNEVVFLATDAVSITVANDSCVDFWLLVTAGVGSATLPGS
jgi:hypothetical protein